jgi:hypothetical protein
VGSTHHQYFFLKAMTAAANNATTSSMRLMPYHHTRGLLSTLRVFRGDDDDVRRVHVPLSVIIPYWQLLCGVSRSTALFTVAALERDGSLSLTKYDDGTGSAEYWESTETISDVADVLLEHGGLYSLIPRLVQVGDEEQDEERSESETSAQDIEDSFLQRGGDGGGLGGSQNLSAQRFVNTATAELRKVKDEMSRLQASSMPVDGEPTEVFMFPREADIYRAAQRAHKAQQRRGSDASHPGDDRAPTPRATLNSSATLLPGGGEEIVAAPPDLLRRIDDIDVSGVFVVLNGRQLQEAIEVEANGVAVSVASNVTFGVVHDSSAPVSAFASLQAQQQKEKLIFSSACTDQRLHEKVVDAYKTMLRKKDAPPSAVSDEPWALGPQDNYYFRNIEHHVRQAAYRFDLSLSWRIALLMNVYPERFEPVFGDQPQAVQAAADVSPGGAEDIFAVGGLSSNEGPVSSMMGWLSSAPSRGVPPYYLAALQEGQVGQTSQTAATPSGGAEEGIEDLIPFLAKRCPLVALAAAKGERSLLHANKKAALATERSSSSARKSKMQSSAQGAASSAQSPYDEGFSVQGPLSPAGGSGLQSPTLRRAGSLSSQSSSTAFSGAANTVAGGATHFSAEPFQRMLDGALNALSTFPDLVRACIEGQRVVDCELARFVLQTCIIDMTEGQVALADAIETYIRTNTFTVEATSLLTSTATLERPFVISPAELETLRVASRRLLTTMLHALCASMHPSADSLGLDGDDSSDAVTRSAAVENRLALQTISVAIRTLFTNGHRLLFPAAFPQQHLIHVLHGRAKEPSACNVAEYLAWLRVLRTITRCFDGTPVQPREDFIDSADDATVLRQEVEQLYQWCVSSTSPALRWASSYILHNRRRNEERCAFIEDVVHAYWVRTDSVGIVHGIADVSPDGTGGFVDAVQQVAEFVRSLGLDYTDHQCDGTGWGVHTANNWNVLPPRMQRAMRSGLVTLPSFMCDDG